MNGNVSEMNVYCAGVLFNLVVCDTGAYSVPLGCGEEHNKGKFVMESNFHIEFLGGR